MGFGVKPHNAISYSTCLDLFFIEKDLRIHSFKMTNVSTL